MKFLGEELKIIRKVIVDEKEKSVVSNREETLSLDKEPNHVKELRTILDELENYISKYAPDVTIPPGSEVELAAIELGLDSTMISWETYRTLLSHKFKSIKDTQWVQ